jgi:NitT/TauT family transport system substrate-binding protein
MLLANSPRPFQRLAGLALLAVAGFTAFGLAGCGPKKDEAKLLRAGFFPNVTHAQAVIAREMEREGNPWFEKRLPAGWKLEWMSFNAGPSAMEALVAESTDVTYVGPSPVINIHTKTKGAHARVIAGAATGGSALLVPKDSALKTPADFRGKRIATPQLGNTQDVACRAWLAEGGLKITMTGGDASVIPTPNSEQSDMLAAGRTDAVWTVEPWVARIEKQTGAKVILERPDETTTVLVADKRVFSNAKKPAVEAFLAAHRELTLWIQAHPAEAVNLLHKGLSYEQRAKDLPKDIVERAFARVKLTNSVNFADLDKAMKDAHKAGLLPSTADLAPLREFYHEEPRQ